MPVRHAHPVEGGTISKLGLTSDASGLADDACVRAHGLGTYHREVREDGGNLPLGLASGRQGLVDRTPTVVVPDVGVQEEIKDVGQESMAATHAAEDIDHCCSRLLIKGKLGGRQPLSPLLGQMLVSLKLEIVVRQAEREVKQ